MAAGRNRGFSTDQAITAAMTTFWQRGFSGTSLNDLTHAMGINKSSLYGTFKNKESLFISAVTLYSRLHGKPLVELLFDQQEQDPLIRIQRYLNALVDFVTAKTCPDGCLITNSTCELNDDVLPEAAAQTVHQLNEETLTAFRSFFEQEKMDQNLSAIGTAEDCANYLMTLQFGLAVMAKNGASEKSLRQTAVLGMRAFTGTGEAFANGSAVSSKNA